MRVILKTLRIMVLTVFITVCSVFPCFAATQTGGLTVVLQDDQNHPIDHVTVQICKIADLCADGYALAEPFETSGISLSAVIDHPDEINARAVFNYVVQQMIEGTAKQTENGKTSFVALDLGIWLVYCSDGSDIFNPFFVFLPCETNGTLLYEVVSSPKVDVTPQRMDVYVQKLWDDHQNVAKKRPNSVTVELLNHEQVIDSIELSENNGWSHTFTNVSKIDGYSVREQAVPNYQAYYSGDVQHGFVITNTYEGERLPQTGQQWLPIILITIAGLCFLLLGFYEIKMRSR